MSRTRVYRGFLIEYRDTYGPGPAKSGWYILNGPQYDRYRMKLPDPPYQDWYVEKIIDDLLGPNASAEESGGRSGSSNDDDTPLFWQQHPKLQRNILLLTYGLPVYYFLGSIILDFLGVSKENIVLGLVIISGLLVLHIMYVVLHMAIFAFKEILNIGK